MQFAIQNNILIADCSVTRNQQVVIHIFFLEYHKSEVVKHHDNWIFWNMKYIIFFKFINLSNSQKNTITLIAKIQNVSLISQK